MLHDIRQAAIAAVAASMLAATPALAQDVLVPSQGANEIRADWIIGSTVTSTQGETIGSIQDLILHSEDGSVVAAVIGVGGFLGLGAKNIAVDWNELQIDWDGNDITLNLTREQADQAAEYTFRDRETAPPPPPDAGGTAPATGTAPMTDPAPTAPPPMDDTPATDATGPLGDDSADPDADAEAEQPAID